MCYAEIGKHSLRLPSARTCAQHNISSTQTYPTRSAGAFRDMTWRSTTNGAGSSQPPPGSRRSRNLGTGFWRRFIGDSLATRRGSLRHTGTPLAMGMRIRPGPQRRLDNRVNAYCRELGFWWIDGAADREMWRLVHVLVLVIAHEVGDGEWGAGVKFRSREAPCNDHLEADAAAVTSTTSGQGFA